MSSHVIINPSSTHSSHVSQASSASHSSPASPVSPLIITPYGEMPYVNADFTASGIPYNPIESFINNKILPWYANTHSNAHNGQLMSHYINQSKDIIRRSVGAKPCDKVIFTGNGCSGAIIHLIHNLDLKENIKGSLKTVVFISVAEHHSNYLPWIHLPIQLVVIPMDAHGKINIIHLKKELDKYKKHPIVGCFIAGSNVTGVIQPIKEISILIHDYNGLVFWDYAGCAPYVRINMHAGPKEYFDGIMISPHKFLGGPGTPGILISNCDTFKNKEPFCPGGGTVRFVCKKYTHYNENIEIRETGGTPNIIGCIKAGLVFQLKDKHLNNIISRNKAINKRVRKGLTGVVELITPDSNEIPIYSFRIKGLHYNFIVALLNDLYGIQSRGGVSCCSLYAQQLLKVKPDSIHHQIESNKGVPGDYGWCRVTFHYTMSNRTVDFILQAIKKIASDGSEYLNEYEYIPEKNNWEHKKFKMNFPDLNL